MDKTQWENGKGVSLHFYRKTIFAKAEAFNKIFKLPGYFKPMIGDKKEVEIADLGAGMFSTTGCFWDTAVVHLFPSDIMADEYRAIMNEYGIKPIVPVEHQDMEHLTYPECTFDIVHCANALDHCIDPIAALKEMYRVCKLGGWIYLRHFSHVAEHQKYCGMHGWNLDLLNTDDCRIWNKEKSFSLAELFPGFHTVLKKEMPYDAKNMVVSTLYKTYENNSD